MKLLLKVTFLKHVYNSYSTGISQFWTNYTKTSPLFPTDFEHWIW
jgi:hypothetical protein